MGSFGSSSVLVLGCWRLGVDASALPPRCWCIVGGALLWVLVLWWWCFGAGASVLVPWRWYMALVPRCLRFGVRALVFAPWCWRLGVGGGVSFVSVMSSQHADSFSAPTGWRFRNGWFLQASPRGPSLRTWIEPRCRPRHQDEGRSGKFTEIVGPQAEHIRTAMEKRPDAVVKGMVSQGLFRIAADCHVQIADGPGWLSKSVDLRARVRANDAEAILEVK